MGKTYACILVIVVVNTHFDKVSMLNKIQYIPPGGSFGGVFDISVED